MSLYSSKALSLTRSSLQQTSKRIYHSSKPTLSSSSTNPITSFPKTHPFAFQLFVATGKTSAADILVQVVAEKKKWNEIDWKRNGIFVVFGFACKFIIFYHHMYVHFQTMISHCRTSIFTLRFGMLSILVDDNEI